MSDTGQVQEAILKRLHNGTMLCDGPGERRRLPELDRHRVGALSGRRRASLRLPADLDDGPD
jgi:hypothetical protein